MTSRENFSDAELVFRGKIIEIGTTTMTALAASDLTTTVAVEEVYRAPEVLKLLAGKTITVILKDREGLSAGDDIFFLTKGWLYGESIAVFELGRAHVQVADKEGFVQRLNEEAQVWKDEALAERIHNATLIVAGSVVETRSLETAKLQPINEHMPMWAEAVVMVTSTERGPPPSQNIVVVYPESRDVMWYRTPKFQKGDSGVWILRNEPIQGLERVGLTALHPLDFQPTSELQHIRTIIQQKK
jgi:hypothetical protein